MPFFLKTQKGFITDATFGKSDSMLCYSTECVSTRPYGIAFALPMQYKYGGVHHLRKPMATVSSRSRMEDRATPGTIKMEKGDGGPTITALFTQFGIGAPLENNQIAQSQVMRSQDRAYVEGLKRDTGKHRLRYFEECLERISGEVGDDIKKIYFPSGIGCRGIVDGFWKENYLPLLERLAEEEKKKKKREVILITLQDDDDDDDDRDDDDDDDDDASSTESGFSDLDTKAMGPPPAAGMRKRKLEDDDIPQKTMESCGGTMMKKTKKKKNEDAIPPSQD